MDPRDSKSVPLKTGVFIPRFPLKQVPLYITFRTAGVWTLFCSLYVYVCYVYYVYYSKHDVSGTTSLHSYFF